MSSLNLYKSYNFVDKDPVIDLMSGISQRNKISIPKIAADSGVSEATIRNWFFGKTKRPQFATVAAVMSAMGYRINWSFQDKVMPHMARDLMGQLAKDIEARL